MNKITVFPISWKCFAFKQKRKAKMGIAFDGIKKGLYESDNVTEIV